MSTETLLLIAIPSFLVVLIIWYSAKNDKSHEDIVTEEGDDLLYDPLTGKRMSVEEAEQGLELSEQEEGTILEDIEFEEIQSEGAGKQDERTDKEEEKKEE